jgi:ATP-binding cassette, subfamily B, multidrug efflux pump
MSLRRLITSHLGPYRSTLMIVVALQAVQAFATLTLPGLNADLIDNGVLVGDNAYIWRVGGIMLVFTLVQILFAAGATWFGARAAMGFGRDVRRDLFHQVTSYSAREVGSFGAPSLITRITNDVQQVQTLIVLVSTMMIAAPLTMTIGLALAIREDIGLSVVLAIAIPAAVLILGLVIVQMVPAFRLMQVRIDRVNTVLREQITGIRVVRAFVREPQETARFATANADLTTVSLRVGRLMSLMFPTVGLIMNMSSLAVLWVGADRIAAGQMQVGSLIAYLSYLVQVLMAVMMLTFMTSLIPRAGVAADRILDVLDTQSSVEVPTSPVREMPERGTLEFRAVSFRYPGAEHPVLDDLSFKVGPGQTLGVIGSTGSGKTTLVNLALRLIDATSGIVLVNGVDVRHLDPALLWGTIGYVPQKAYLFSGTVASNLRFGRPDASDGELWQALEIAQAAGFVQSMPDGIESSVNQGGTNVSGGQRQRLAMARAIAVKPEIYVFDDSFSALDLATDARLRAALAPHTALAAVLVVAQRIATIRHADEILVLDDGAVVGRGTHDELVVSCPTYAEIVASQYGEGAVA